MQKSGLKHTKMNPKYVHKSEQNSRPKTLIWTQLDLKWTKAKYQQGPVPKSIKMVQIQLKGSKIA